MGAGGALADAQLGGDVLIGLADGDQPEHLAFSPGQRGPGPRRAQRLDEAAGDGRVQSLWRNLLGVAYALTVTFTPGQGQLTIGLGGHEWVDAAVSGAIGLVAVPPVLLGTAYGIWKENQLDKEVWQVIDERVNAPGEPGP